MYGVVVYDCVDLPSDGHRPLGLVEERDELLMAVGVSADDRPIQNVQRGEQSRDTVPLLVERHRRGLPRLSRQPFLRPPECLDLRLLVDQKITARSGESMYNVMTSWVFFAKSGSVENL